MLRSYTTDPNVRGIIHHLWKPIAQRLKDRKGPCGPYFWPQDVRAPRNGVGFYSSGKSALVMDRAGSTVSLRLEWANDHLRHSRLARIDGYYCDAFGSGDTLQPIIARLPHGRGFLAGWTMGAGMCGSLDADIYDTEQDAAFAAHNMAEQDAAETIAQHAVFK